MQTTRTALCIAIFLTACGASESEDNRWPDVDQTFEDYVGEGASEGQLLPVFEAVDQFGDAVDSRQFLGAVSVVDLGAVWCQPCQQAAETQQSWADSLMSEGDLTVVSVLLQERSGGPPDAGDAAEWADTFGLTIPVLADERAQLQTAWSISQWPTILVVAPDGEVVRRFDGAVDEAVVSDAVRDAWASR